MRRILPATASLVFALAAAAAAQVPQPKLSATHPTGAKAGTTVELKVTAGVDTDFAEGLVFSHPGIKAERLLLPPDRFYPEARAVENTFKVTVGADVPPGIYDLRVAGHFGMSNSRRFVVGDLPEALEREPNSEPAQAVEFPLDSVVNGTCDAQAYDYYKLPVKKGQRVVIDCAAVRIDSKSLVVLTLQDPSGRTIDRAASTRHGDAMLDFVAEADGACLLRVNELTFRGGDDQFYRLTATTGPWIDFVDPPVVKAGGETPVTVYGRNLPGGRKAEGIAIDGRPLEMLAVTIQGPKDSSAAELPLDTMLRPADVGVDFISYRLASPRGRSNPVRLMVSDQVPAAEAEPNNDPAQAQAVKLPADLVGRLEPRGDRDGYVFEAKKGDKIWIEVFSQRLGVPMDPAITVQQVGAGEKGPSLKDLQDVDDQPSPMPKMANNMERRYRMAPEDPGILFSVPEDAKYRVIVRDLYGGGYEDPRFMYRLVIRPARPDFRMVAFPVEAFPAENRLNPGASVLRRGGVERVRVVAVRRENFTGPIRVEAEQLPKGVTAKPVTIASDSTSAELVLRAEADAPAFSGPVRIVGKAEVDGRAVSRAVHSAEVMWIVADQQKDAFATKMTQGLMLSVDDRFTAPFAAKLGDEARPVYRMCRGGVLKIPAKLVKQSDYKDAEKASVKLATLGLPNPQNQKLVNAKDLTIPAAKPEGELEIEVTDKAPLGSFNAYVAGEVTMPYRPMGERAKAMDGEKARVEKIAAELAAELKQAEAARAKAEQEAQAAAKALEAAKAKGGEGVAEVEAKAKAAEAAKAKAAEAEKSLKEQIAKGEELKKKFADSTKKMADASKEKAIKVWVASLPIAIEIVEKAVSLQADAASVGLAAGGSTEIALAVNRDCGFDGELKLDLVAPQGVPIKLHQGQTIPKGQTVAQAVLGADKGAKAGKHAVTLRATYTFNGKPVTVDQAITVEVGAP
jgi:hypothetical protein